MKNEYIIDGDMVRIILKRRNKESLEVLIDLEDLEKVKLLGLSWHAKYEPYVDSYYCKATKYLGTFNGKPKYQTVHLHRIIMNVEGIENGRHNVSDHKNHNTLDNRKSNLVIRNIDDNMKNRKSKNSNNTSGYRNVSWNSRENKWVVQLQVNGKNTKLGMFDDVHEAGRFANEMRLKYYGKEFEFNKSE